MKRCVLCPRKVPNEDGPICSECMDYIEARAETPLEERTEDAENAEEPFA